MLNNSINWDELKFNININTKIILCYYKNNSWNDYIITDYQPLSLDPVSTILNYGQDIFEDMKAYKTHKDNIVLFRPEMNYNRLIDGCNRMLIPPINKELFLEMCEKLINANNDFIPPYNKGELYIRPLILGSKASLSVIPSSEYIFVMYCSPVGRYFNNNGKLLIEFNHKRPSNLGVGNIKIPGNYAPCLLYHKNAKSQNYTDILYLDFSNKYIEEASTSNFFCIIKNVIKTPNLKNILPGITRDSIISIIHELGYIIEECNISLDELLHSDEAFICGTTEGSKTTEGCCTTEVCCTDVGITNIELINFNGYDKIYDNFTLTNIINSHLFNIKYELINDTNNWLYKIN